MEISSSAQSAATATSGVSAGVSVLKKSLELEALLAQQLLASLAQPQTPNLPPHLGNHVNTKV